MSSVNGIGPVVVSPGIDDSKLRKIRFLQAAQNALLGLGEKFAHTKVGRAGSHLAGKVKEGVWELSVEGTMAQKLHLTKADWDLLPTFCMLNATINDVQRDEEQFKDALVDIGQELSMQGAPILKGKDKEGKTFVVREMLTKEGQNTSYVMISAIPGVLSRECHVFGTYHFTIKDIDGKEDESGVVPIISTIEFKEMAGAYFRRTDSSDWKEVMTGSVISDGWEEV